MKFLLLFLGIGMLFFSSCENEMAEIQRIIPEDFVGKETFKNIELLYSDSAIVRVRVIAPSMIRHLDRKNPRQEFDQGVKVDFLGARKNVQSKLTSNYAVRLLKEKQIIARDSVELISTRNERLETSELIWDERQEKIYTNKFVMITTPEEKIWGYGFEANQEFTRWSIKAIEGELKVEDFQKELED